MSDSVKMASEGNGKRRKSSSNNTASSEREIKSSRKRSSANTAGAGEGDKVARKRSVSGVGGAGAEKTKRKHSTSKPARRSPRFVCNVVRFVFTISAH